MKYMFEKLAVSIVGLGLSILVAILGMYLVFNSQLKFLQHLLYSAAFILQPVMTVVLIRYMFRKQDGKKTGDAYDEYDELDDEDDEEEDTQPVFGLFGKKKKPAASAPASHEQPQTRPEPAPAPEYPENEIPEASFDTGYDSHETAPDELDRMEHTAADIPDPSFAPAEDSSLAGAIGRKFSGLFGGSNGDDL
ncbi:MAG: hypothetical protein UH229_03400 [Lachnospiraceae bacterium]|nr:hypothetical protein [Lachnospiraceae bacterium]